MNDTILGQLKHRSLPSFESAAGVNGTPITMTVGCAYAKAMTVRFLSAVAGTLTIRLLRPDRQSEYPVSQPSDTAIVGGTGVRVQVADMEGCAHVRITFTPSANGTVNYCDVSYAVV